MLWIYTWTMMYALIHKYVVHTRQWRKHTYPLSKLISSHVRNVMFGFRLNIYDYPQGLLEHVMGYTVEHPIKKHIHQYFLSVSSHSEINRRPCIKSIRQPLPLPHKHKCRDRSWPSRIIEFKVLVSILTCGWISRKVFPFRVGVHIDSKHIAFPILGFGARCSKKSDIWTLPDAIRPEIIPWVGSVRPVTPLSPVANDAKWIVLSFTMLLTYGQELPGWCERCSDSRTPWPRWTVHKLYWLPPV